MTEADSEQRRFPLAPVLEDISEWARLETPFDWSSIAVVGVQHLLASTGSLVEALIALGVSPDSIMLCGKSYSTSETVARRLRELGVHVFSPADSGRMVGFQTTFRPAVDKLWAFVRKHPRLKEWRQIVVLDDGGHCIDRAPNLPAIRDRLTAVEQTTAGIRRLETINTVPVVNVAQSAAKTILESPLICEVILERAKEYLAVGSRVGVVGVGNIGSALTKCLIESGYKVESFDRERLPERVFAVAGTSGTLQSLLDRSDVIFGCTGEDAFGTDWFDRLDHDVTLISCSSEDLEFRPLITLLVRTRRIGGGQTEDIRVDTGRARLIIARGGFPVNFDGSEESVPSADIQLTRGLLLGGIIQALLPDCRPGISMLVPCIQQEVVQSWFRHRPERSIEYSKEAIDGFADTEWIKRHSSGH